jgi:hypothetical protein
MADHPGRDTLDGGWWPQSRDLAVELADLTDHFPPELGRIQRAVFSPPDWDPAPRRIPVGRGGFLEVGSFPADDTHVVILRTSDRLTLRVLVVPPGLTADQGDEAMTAAATSGNSHSAASLLETVLDEPDRDPRDQWTDAPSDPWSP